MEEPEKEKEEKNWLGKKVHIGGKSKEVSMMIDKDKYEIFLCDKENSHLESLSTQKLEKNHIKQERY